MKKVGIILNKNKNILIFIFLIIFISSLCSAITYKKDSIIDFKESCTFNGAVCNSSASCNLSIKYPNSTYLIQDELMTNKLNGDFNYTLYESETGVIGENYKWDMYCCQVGFCNEAHGIYNINLLGTELTTQESLIYILLTAGVFLIFGLSFYFAIAIPYSNKKNEKGAIIQITKTKYIKILMIGVTYALFVWFLNLLIGVSNNFTNLTLYYGFISFLFITFINLTLPFSIFLLVLAFFEIIRDSNVMNEIKKYGSSNR